jgi:hypothetical protein
MNEESGSDATKLVNVGPNTTIRDIIGQLLWVPSPPEDQSNDHKENHRKPKPTPQPTMTNKIPTTTSTGIFTLNSILIILDFLLIVNVKFIIS